MKRLIFFMLCLVLLPVLAEAASRPTVFVSILPQKYFVEQISGNLVDVQVLLPPGANPTLYEPKGSQMMALAHAPLYFAIGVPFERSWLGRMRAINPEIKIIHTDLGIEKRMMTAHHHGEEEAEEHSVEQGIPDPHIWLSPRLVKIQAKNILAGLQQILPDYAGELARRYTVFQKKLEDLDRQLSELFGRFSGTEFLVFHPSWGYLAQDYGLHQISVEMEGKEPGPVQLRELIDRCRRDGIHTILVQPQFSQKKARIVAREIGGQVIEADPLAVNWAENLIMVAESIRRSSQ